MTTEIKQKLIYDLTLEYVKQNELLKCHQDSLETRIEGIAKISEIIDNAVSNNINKFKL